MSQQSSQFELFHYWRSTSSWRVRWALFEKGIECKMHAVNLLDGDQKGASHLERNPMGQVPVLRIGNRYLSESTAICEWLEESFPSPALLPQSPDDRAQVRELMQTINAGTQPVQNLAVQKKVASEKKERLEWARYWIEKGLTAYEKRAQKTAGQFSFGGTLTLADLFLIPQCYNALRFGLSLQDFPLVRQIYQNCRETAGYRASEPGKYQPANS